MNWRRSEFIAITGPIVTILLWVWFASARANTWDGTSEKVAKLEPIVAEQGKQLAVLVDAVSDMRDDVRYIRRHSVR